MKTLQPTNEKNDRKTERESNASEKEQNNIIAFCLFVDLMAKFITQHQWCEKRRNEISTQNNGMTEPRMSRSDR